ncbi:MAG: anthranilate synthase component I family protein [Alphaproteobacteria bacterium]|nr:anthranilate synthase component I family protein [Alphaproteobacteria bacterium]
MPPAPILQPPFDIPADLDTPVSAFLKLAPFDPLFLLESVEGGERVGRYSFIGFGAGLSLRIDGDVVRTTEGDRVEEQPVPDSPEGVLDLLRAALARAPRPGPRVEGLPFHGGLVGAIGYDLVRRLERVRVDGPKAGPATPDASWVAPRSLLVFDHSTRRVALLHDGTDEERAALRRDVVFALRGAVPTRRAPGAYATPQATFEQAAFEAAVRRVKEEITAGEVFQLVLSARLEGACDLDPFEVYRALRLLNPSPYMFFCRLPGRTLPDGRDGALHCIGSSPEALVRLHGRTATLRPIAGTRPRGADPAQDAALADELLADAKELAEHVMLVDLARNDAGRVARTDSVQVDPYRIVERYSHVMHTVSGVTAELRDAVDALDLFAACFPAGTVSGAPKVRAMELIDQLEPARRGLYAGTVGYFGVDPDGRPGDMDQAISIRTMFMYDTPDGGRYEMQAGAGIVADSVPASEYREVMAKAAALGAALALAERGL